MLVLWGCPEETVLLKKCDKLFICSGPKSLSILLSNTISLGVHSGIVFWCNFDKLLYQKGNNEGQIYSDTGTKCTLI